MKTTVKDLKKAIKEAISEVEGAPNTLSLQRDIADALLPLISSMTSAVSQKHLLAIARKNPTIKDLTEEEMDNLVRGIVIASAHASGGLGGILGIIVRHVLEGAQGAADRFFTPKY